MSRSRAGALLLLIALLAAILLAAIAEARQSTSAPATTDPSDVSPQGGYAQVLIWDYEFTPRITTIYAGSEVQWISALATVTHTVTGPDWGSGDIEPWRLWGRAFDTPGVYYYHCEYHPLDMNGVVIVETGPEPNWWTPVDTAGDVGKYAQIALREFANGVVAYYDTTEANLKVASCGDPACTTGNTITSPATVESVGLYPSLEIRPGGPAPQPLASNGNPVVSYYFTSGGNLQVLSCGDPTCTTGNTIAYPDSLGDVGLFSSLALDSSGFPVVAYYDAYPNNDLKVLHCGNLTCTAGNTIASPDTASDVGQYTSLVLDASGNPVISYLDFTNKDLKVLHCGNPTCTADNTIVSPDTAGYVGWYTSLVLDASGNPVVAYYDNTNHDLKVLHCGNPTCTTGNTITSPDTIGTVGRYPSLALDAYGNPVVSYYDFTNGDLKVLHCGDPYCTAGNFFASPDTAGNVGQYTSLALDAYGSPVVAYYDATNGDLKVLKCGDPTCGVGVVAPPEATPTPTPTATPTAAVPPTVTNTATPTGTATPTATSTKTATPAVTPTSTPTSLATPTATPTATLSPTPGPPLADSPWPIFHRDLHHTGRTLSVGPSTPIVKWKYATSAVFASSPVIGPDGTIYVGASDGGVYAVYPDGQLRWTFHTGGPFQSSPVVAADGRVYAASNDGYLYALASNGTLLWRMQTVGVVQGAMWSSPAIGGDGTVYVGAGRGGYSPGSVYAVNPNGTVKWTIPTSVGVATSPAVSTDGTVYLGTDSSLTAFNPNGTIKWQYTTGGHVYSSPAIGEDGTIYFGSDDTYVYAINPNGTLRWRHKTSGIFRTSPAIAGDGTVIIGSFDRKVYALGTSGLLLWTFAIQADIFSSPAIDGDGSIYFGTNDGSIYALTSDGTVKWRFLTGGPVGSSPSLGRDGTLYIGSDDGQLYAFRATTGQLSGRVVLQGRSVHSGAVVRAGSQITTAMTGQDGSYFLAGLDPGSYTVTVTMTNYLASERSPVVIEAGMITTLPPVTLLSGDIRDDGVVNILDLVIAATAFGSDPTKPNWNPEADLNLDNRVNIQDLILVAVNFGKRAPSPWP